MTPAKHWTANTLKSSSAFSSAGFCYSNLRPLPTVWSHIHLQVCSSLRPHLSFCLALLGSVCMLNCSMFRRSLSLRRFLCSSEGKFKKKREKKGKRRQGHQSPRSHKLPKLSSELCLRTHYLGESHPVSLVSRLLCPCRIHQLEAGLILLVEIGVLTSTAKLR